MASDDSSNPNEPAPLWDEDDAQPTMSLGDHLDELRRRLILSLIGFAVCVVFTFYFGNEIIWWLNRPLLQIQRIAGITPQTYTFAVSEYFMVYVKVSLISGLIVASPWILYQGWQFVSAGLYKSERRAVLLLTPMSVVLTTLGVLFTYYIMLPVCLAFLLLFALAAPPAGETQSSFIERITSAYQEAEHRADDHDDTLLIDPVGDDDQDGESTGQDKQQATAIDVDATPAGSEAETPGDELPSLAMLPQLSSDPVRPREGQIWVKLPEQEVRVHLSGVTRVVSLTATSGVAPMIGVSQYIGFASLIMLGVVAAFQLPLVMLIIGWTGLLDPQLIKPYRRHCAVACFVAGAVLTPADPISMVVMAVPLLILFETGLLLMRWAYKKAVPDAPDIE